MVTHDEDLARQVSRAVTIADGQIAADTRHELSGAPRPAAGASRTTRRPWDAAWQPGKGQGAHRTGERKLGLFPQDGVFSPVPVA